MAKETQKAKIERLEKENIELKEQIEELYTQLKERDKCIDDMQSKANRDFSNSNDKEQMKSKIELLELKIKQYESTREHNNNLISSKDRQIEELKEELLSVQLENEHKKLGRKTKFNEEQKKEIVSQGKTKSIRQLAREFNCSIGLVHKILKESEH